MNPRFLVVPLLAAAMTAGVWFFLGTASHVSVGTLTVPDDSVGVAQSEAAEEKKRAHGNSADSSAKKPAVDWKVFALLSGKSGGDGSQIPNPTAADIARFLAKNGETPVNLITAYEHLRDSSLLERALELFPNSPVVLMAAVDSIPGGSPKDGEPYQSDPRRMAYIERFKAGDPNNPLPWIFAAQEFFKSGQTADALADIRAALGRPAFYTYASERMDSAQQLYEDLGIHPLEASALAMFGITLPHMTAANQSSRSLMELQKSAAESGDTAASDEALRLTYSLGRTFATPEASRMLIGQLIGIAMEKRALEALPSGSQPDWLKVSPTERLAEIEQQKAGVKEVVTGIESVVQAQDAELLAEFLRRVRTESEAASYEWLKKQKK